MKFKGKHLMEARTVRPWLNPFLMESIILLEVPKKIRRPQLSNPAIWNPPLFKDLDWTDISISTSLEDSNIFEKNNPNIIVLATLLAGGLLVCYSLVSLDHFLLR
jgi:hypothetical protein